MYFTFTRIHTNNTFSVDPKVWKKLTQLPRHSSDEVIAILHEMNAFFYKAFNKEPEFFLRVPGRVNIIGEHVDYNLLPVLPMAINSCILLAVSSNAEASILELKNMDNNRYPDFKCNMTDITINVPKEDNEISHDWYNYFLCGLKGIYEMLASNNKGVVPSPLPGMQVAVFGTIPPASGLASSSALVCSAVIATAYVHKMEMDPINLIKLAVHSERFIGTEGGGMDHAIAFLGVFGYAQKIDFHPILRHTIIPLPIGMHIVIANSMVKKNKASTSDFNQRVVECRLACRILTYHLNINEWRSMLTFKQLIDGTHYETYEHVIEDIKEYINKDLYTRQELCELLELSDNEFSEEFLTTNTKHLQNFKIKQRALHVMQEAQRVENFCNICIDSFLTSRPEECFNKLKEILSESHQSLKLLYECSHPEVDKLVDLAASIHIGARLMGAGWGGCIVALCSSAEQSQQLINLLKQTFYKDLPNDIVNKNVFIAKSEYGAQLISKWDMQAVVQEVHKYLESKSHQS